MYSEGRCGKIRSSRSSFAIEFQASLGYMRTCPKTKDVNKYIKNQTSIQMNQKLALNPCLSLKC